MPTPAEPPEPGTASGDRVTLRAKLSLVILTVFYMLFFLDKQIFSLLANMLGESLDFGDTQLGILQGFAYSIPYSLNVLFVGWLVDRYSRRGVLFGGVLLWSMAAAASGLATSFTTMAFARAGVGFGEAALIPAALPLLAAIFPRDKVSGAIGLFYAGANVGGFLANLVGGMLIDTLVAAGDIRVPILGLIAPWQATFLVTGLPGVALAFLAWGLAEPKVARVARTLKQATETTLTEGRQTMAGYFRDHWFFFVTYTLATSTMSLSAYTLFAWSAPYFGRTYGWSNTVIGAATALGMVVSMAGNPLWGVVADRLRRKGHLDGVYRVFIPLVVLGVPFTAIGYLVQIPAVTIVFYLLSHLSLAAFGANMSALQLAAPAHLRGRLTGI